MSTSDRRRCGLAAARAVKTIRIAALGAGVLMVASQALAQAYPQRSVTIVAPYPPGGPVDAVARVIGRSLGAEWGRAVIIDNRSGAAGNIGSEFVVRAPPDGHTLLGNTGALLVNAIVQEKPAFDPLRDLLPITKIGFAPALLLVNAKSPFNTVADLVAFGKANPGKLSFGSPGTPPPCTCARNYSERSPGSMRSTFLSVDQHRR